MSILSWGKCTLSYTTSTNGAPASGASWTNLDTPKEDSTKLTATAGNEVEATEEGGAIVDFRRAKYKYDFETQLFVKKGMTRPFQDTDGVVMGEYALRLLPEDETCEGFQIDRCMLSIEDSFSTADGKLLTLRAKILKPASGNQIKPFSKVTLNVSCESEQGTVKIGNGTPDTEVSAICNKGESVSITAIAASGYTFSKWSDDDSTTNPRTLTVNSNLDIEAEFTAN